MIAPPSRSFHTYIDQRVRAHQVFHPTTGWTHHEFSKHTKTEDRKLRYSFYLHAHPYVAELVKRLINHDIPGLQAADIDYQRAKDGKFVPLKDDFGKEQTLAD